jgi:hypothetical protein
MGFFLEKMVSFVHVSQRAVSFIALPLTPALFKKVCSSALLLSPHFTVSAGTLPAPLYP